MPYREDPPELATRGRGAHLPVLERITVAAPCPVRWDAMVGDDRVRHCSSCDQQVYDTRAMTTAEVEGLVAQVMAGNPVCGRLYRRPDGSLITRDCADARLARVRAMRRRWATSVVAASAIAVAWWMVPANEAPTGAVQVELSQGRSRMGRALDLRDGLETAELVPTATACRLDPTRCIVIDQAASSGRLVVLPGSIDVDDRASSIDEPLPVE